jgi:high affinity Mn2+ porin
MRGAVFTGIALAGLTQCAHAADLSGLPTKAPPPVSYDWTGFYLGGHIGYALGGSNWSAMPASLSGSLNFSNAYNFSSGTGSYLLGFQAGYDTMTASRWLLGVAADVSFPSFVGGNRTTSSALIGTANYLEQVEFSGDMRARIGYALGNWLYYVTGGFAWSYDQFTRTQLGGFPAGGTAVPGTVENLYLEPRVGGVVGAGVEVALAPHWTAQFEYLFTDYDTRGVTFPAGAQQFNSNLTLSELRVGLDYRLGQNGLDSDIFTRGPSALDLGGFVVHGQTTFIEQYAPPFHAPYQGRNSLDSNAGREAWETMFAAGLELWPGAELWIDPEIDQGFGLSDTEGVAGYVNGAASKVGAAAPYARIQRAFVRQTIDLGGDTQKVDADQNQFAGSQTSDRLVLTIGKYSVTDIFDTNDYAHDAYTDFMNWALIDTGTFDYASDAWGYTYGASAEWYRGDWTLRGGLFDLPVVPNSTELDPQFAQFQWLGEVERRWELGEHPGKIAVTGFLSRGRLGSYQDAIELAQITGGPADISAVRQYTSRGGVSLNLEQEITSDLGAFARAGMANGNVEPGAYTDIDRTAAAGLQLSGKQWGRPDDTFGLAGVVNGITKIHQQFLNDGGLGILVGDGMLPHPGPEQILETYYEFPVSDFKLTLDYQFIVNPGYNEDRGPASVIGARAHTEF